MAELQSAIDRIAGSRRVLVLGSSGSGKTTLSLRLGRALDLPVIHLDRHFWRAGWLHTPQLEWHAKVEELVQRDSWIMDGTYERSLDLRLPRADTIVVLHRSRLVCLWRICKRKWTIDDARRPDAPAGQKLDWAFVKYVWLYPTVTEPFVAAAIRKHGMEQRVIDLMGRRASDQFLSRLE